ncbi:hypothetical protein, partial [Vibrio cholerae]|uniref:hypothetical protein n=1 Tax=Vibrio cholerae TaxID=666 RepID=UPI001645F8AB
MKRSRYKSLKGNIDSGCLEPNETEYLSKLAAREQFWLATGLWADSSFRKLAIDVDSDEDINVTFRQIVLAKEHITERDGIFIVSVSKSDRFKAKFDTWFSNISMFMSLCCFLFSFAAVLIVGWNAFILIAFSIYFAFLGILSASSSIHTNVAIRITPELEKLLSIKFEVQRSVIISNKTFLWCFKAQTSSGSVVKFVGNRVAL